MFVDVFAQNTEPKNTSTSLLIPDPALLEMLGEMENLEQMGIDVDHLIEQKLLPEAESEQKELEKQ